jgi:hypothetical protein
MSEDRDELRARLLALEKAVDWLQRDLAQLRAGSIRGAPAQAPPAPQPVIEAQPAPERPPPAAVKPRRPDLETLVGRYGMLALATLLALAAVGTFVGWAIAHGLLGPIPRVVLGLAAAAGIAVFGVRLRRRERSFGDSLLGLSLAIVHVCAWQAGPALHLVPPFAALALSAIASVALGGFALLQEDELLWCVGFGGAAVAPFVTSSGQGTAPMLAAYAAAVLIAGGSALGSRPWMIASRVYGAAAALFTVAIVALPERQHSAELAVGLPFAAAGLGVLPFAHGKVVRPRLRTLGFLAAAAALYAASAPVVPRFTGALAAALAGLAWLALLELVDCEPAGTVLDGFGEADAGVAEWIDGAVVPAAFLLALGVALEMSGYADRAFGLAAPLLVLSVSRRSPGSLRDALGLPAFCAAIAAVLLAMRPNHEVAAAAMAGTSLLFLFLERAVPNRTWQWAPQIALALAGLYALELVTVRPHYQYVPFLTGASAAALAVAVCCGLAASLARTSAAIAGAGIFAFLWVNQELAWAVSPATSTLLLVTWYAATGVGCVAFGRARSAPKIRHAGLGLGIIAALLALKAAWGLPSTAARISAYLVVSAFLLGIAWWYRKPGAQPGAEQSP